MNQYPHILEEVPTGQRILEFKNSINELDGSIQNPYSQPNEWENVRHIVGDLYYAWDKNPQEGQVFLGKWKIK